MGSIKDKNGMDLAEQKILRKGAKNTQKNYTKKIFMTQIITMVYSPSDRHSGMWSQEGLRKHHYKVSGGDRIPVELFQILKDDAVKVLHSLGQQICKTQQWPQDWKRSVFITIPKKGNAKQCSNYCTMALVSHASKVIMLKILQTRLQ